MPKTYINIGQRVKKNAQNVYGWKKVDFIDDNETCVLVLGGNGTITAAASNGYAKHIEKLLERFELNNKVNIYAITYLSDASEEEKFAPFLFQKKSRELLLKRYGRKQMLPETQGEKKYILKAQSLYGSNILDETNPEITDPNYVENLFDKTLLYRISDHDKRLPLEEACKRVQNMKIIAHCHGAYVFLKLEELMQKKMQELGYLKKEASIIQKQLFCVAYAPYAPLGVSKSNMISFASASDDKVWHQNNFHKHIKLLQKLGKLKLSYFPGKQGELFVAPSVTVSQQSDQEHQFWDYFDPKYELSKEGLALLKFASNAIVNGLKATLEAKETPGTKELVCLSDDDKKNFDAATKNGKETYTQIIQSLRAQKSFDLDTRLVSRGCVR